MNYDPADPMGDGLGGYGPQFRRSAAHQLILGNHWVAEQWLRLSLKQGRELEREVDLIKAEQRRMIEISRAVAILQRRRPYEVESWISDPPFPGRFTYIPVIKDVTELVTADMMRHADFSFDVQDHNLYVVTPYLQGEWTDPPLGMAYTYGATPGTPAPDPHRSPVHQGWRRLDANHPMVKWLLRLSHMDLRPAADGPSIRIGSEDKSCEERRRRYDDDHCAEDRHLLLRMRPAHAGPLGPRPRPPGRDVAGQARRPGHDRPARPAGWVRPERP